jgi:hypothetical protein
MLWTRILHADYHWDCTRSYLISLPIMRIMLYQMTLGHVMGWFHGLP